MIRASDWILDLGPEGGDGGGRLLVAGTPEQVMAEPASHTGRALLDYDTERAAVLRAGHALIPAMSTPAVVRDAVADRARDSIVVHRAREHNLRDIDVTIPRDGMTVLTGVSGSGKSTLAFDIIFAEGQRRYLESLNAYARQFVQPASRPDVDAIFGIPPTVAIEQRTSRGGRKSTVGTLTEVYHFLRLLYVKLGVQHCPDCDVPIEPQSADSIAARLLREAKGRKIELLAPLVVARKGYYTDLAKWAAGEGLRGAARRRRMPADRPVAAAGPVPRAHDRAAGRRPCRSAPRREAPTARARSTARSTSARAWCTCVDTRPHARLLHAPRLPDVRRAASPSSTRACSPTTRSTAGARPASAPALRSRASTRSRPARKSGGTTGSKAKPRPVPGLRRPAPESRGARRARSRASRSPSWRRCRSTTRAAFFDDAAARGARGGDRARPAGGDPRRGSRSCSDVGLGYLSLDRAAPTLSGGEAQRIRLAAQLGSNLRGVCYVLDEPTIGLHPRDNRVLLDTLAELGAKGNTLVVVEHDEDTIRRADHLIDLGPGAGTRGGRVVGEGTRGGPHRGARSR